MSFNISSGAFVDAPPPYSASNLTISNLEFFDAADNLITPTSGGGGAPAGYDARIRKIQVTFSGIMPPGGGFRLDYSLRLN